MKVVIYEAQMDSFFSIVCSIVTGSGHSHGAIYNNGKLYDTTFKRGYFTTADSISEKRKVLVVDVDGDCQEWIDANLGTEYDALGLLFWYFRIATVNKMYCFNVVDRALTSIDKHLKLGWRKDGGTILSRLMALGYQPVMMTGKQFNDAYL